MLHVYFPELPKIGSTVDQLFHLILPEEARTVLQPARFSILKLPTNLSPKHGQELFFFISAEFLIHLKPLKKTPMPKPLKNPCMDV